MRGGGEAGMGGGGESGICDWGIGGIKGILRFDLCGTQFKVQLQLEM